MDSDESHFNVSVGSDGQSHKRVSTNHDLFEETVEPKRYRTEVLPLTNLKPRFVIGRMFVREPRWEYSANLVGS